MQKSPFQLNQATTNKDSHVDQHGKKSQNDHIIKNTIDL